MVFYDFEVFKYDWLVVLVNPQTKSEKVIVNDREALTKYYDENKNDIWTGYNSNHYDQYILKGILCGFDPKLINDYIINQKQPGWKFSNLFRRIQLYSYDCSIATNSLKQLEGFMGVAIKETSVPFNINRKLTPNEIKETIKYCKSDVYNTIRIFLKSKNEFDTHMALINTFKLPLNYISKTKAQLSAIILDCQRMDHDDEFDITIVPNLQLVKYAYIKDWYLNPKNQRYRIGDHPNCLEANIAGVPHVFGWGGAHGARLKYHKTGCLLHVDVRSYYPSLMIVYNLLTRNSRHPEKFKEIYDIRIALKKAGKKKEQQPYKIVLNGTYGICKDKNSMAYDPLQANNVCVNGQLLLIDLIEHLESIPDFELVQSNTDGLIIWIPDTDKHFQMVDDVCYEWEQRTGMNLDFDYIDEIWQKDVNNYVFRDQDGKFERKGKYAKELSDLDNDLPIVQTAFIEKIINNTPVETTIMTCADLKQFQMICKITAKYKHLLHGSQKLNEKCVRVFASTDINDGGLKKVHLLKNSAAKFPSTPEHCFIDNDDVNGKKIPNNLDYQFYIKMARERVNSFGII